MTNTIYNNVVGNRVIDNGRVVEDVTSVSIPNFEHPTNTIQNSAMPMAIDMPVQSKFNAMSFAINHNNGKNCTALIRPGIHNIEVRIVREKYNVVKSQMGHESVKYRIKCAHVGKSNNAVENNNPLGGTDTFSVLRIEEEIAGKITNVIDVTGDVTLGGVNISDEIESMLS